MELPIAPIKRFLKKSGLRVSDSAAKEFALLLEETIADLSAEAAAIAKQNNRKTVLEEDVRLAARKIL